MKGTEHNKCFHCDRIIHYNRLDLINGHLVCGECSWAFADEVAAPQNKRKVVLNHGIKTAGERKRDHKAYLQVSIPDKPKKDLSNIPVVTALDNMDLSDSPTGKWNRAFLKSYIQPLRGYNKGE
jgi:hypothetical protein